MTIALRPARSEDFDFCARLYFSGMDKIIRELKLDMALQTVNLRERWDATEVEIITSDGEDVGWMQSSIQDDARFLKQIFIDAPFQRRGIGTGIIHRLIDRANRADQPVTLGWSRPIPRGTSTSGWYFASPTRTTASSTCGAKQTARRPVETSR